MLHYFPHVFSIASAVLKKDLVCESCCRKLKIYIFINYIILVDSHFLSTLLKTSDSDFSSAESNKTQKDCQKQAKVRISAISLIGILAKSIEKKIFVGYWHSIFPQEHPSHATVNTITILNCVMRDPNPKCRIAALQTISMVLHGTKPFLIQAEYSEKPSTSFIPFSITLGNMISTIYAILTESLSGESSLQVLFSILKCLSVLIQVTPLHKLRNGIVTKFVVEIRKLVYHTGFYQFIFKIN